MILEHTLYIDNHTTMKQFKAGYYPILQNHLSVL